MSIDMSQFYQVFFEEAGELLAEMETLLVSIDVAEPSHEDLNAIFRAAHSIKGGAGTFGFSDMTEITHVLETLLDRLRKDELALRDEMVDAFLQACDVLKTQLAGHRGDGSADPAVSAAVKATLQALAGEKPAGSPAPDAAMQAVMARGETASAQQLGKDSANGDKTYRIEFVAWVAGGDRPDTDRLLANLASLGALEVLQQPVSDASDGDARCCARLVTAMPEEDIWEALAFVVDPTHLKIEEEGTVAATPAESASLSAEDALIGKLYDHIVPSAAATPAPAASAAVSKSAPEAGTVLGRRATDHPEGGAANSGRREGDRAPATGNAETSSIRVSVDKVDQMINLVGELVITQSMLAQTASKVDPVIYQTLLNSLAQLERNTRDLQEAVMSIRMMPVSFVFSRFPRVVRDLAAKLGKQVELKTVGEGTELDKGLIEKISDPLTHLVRNSLDHGIEAPERRLAAGKPAKGTITLRAYHQGGNVIIEVSDDGAGLNRERIIAKARESGMAVPDTISDQEVWALIFEAGFSTAEVVTDVSGRGVGMDVVKRNIQALGGRVEINSVVDQGTTIAVRLPLTLAILDGLSVSVGGEMFIVPLAYIAESLQPAEADVRTVAGRGRVVHVRGDYLPVVALYELFNIRPRVRDVHQGILVILEAEGRKTAMFVDELVGQHQVVIKSLESNYRRVQGVSGATIMGDGKVALILDPVMVARGVQALMAEAV